MPCSRLTAGDEVAILPSAKANPSEVLAIGKVASTSLIFVRLVDGSRYNKLAGGCIEDGIERWIVPATDEHRAALKGKKT